MKNLFPIKTSTLHLVLLILLAVAFTACSSSPAPRYYLLGGLDVLDSAAGTPEALEPTSKQTIGLGPFEFPAYLDRSQIVVRRGVELELLDFHRWAEPLEDGFSTALAEHLAEHARLDRVVIFPWSTAQQVDLRVKGRVIRFDVDAAGVAVLAVDWWVQDEEGRIVISERRSQFTQQATSGVVVSMVEALTATVDALAAEIAAWLLEQQILIDAQEGS